MSIVVRHNERSWAIDLISFINATVAPLDLQIKRAGGENTIYISRSCRMFPDVILYSDISQTSILQGWELKLPDTLITDTEFINDAKRKAISLGLNSFFIWNFTAGVLYIKDDNGEFQNKRQWNGTSNIRTRQDVETHRIAWQNLIKDIIIEINRFFINGEAQPASLETVISDNTILMIIARNKEKVASYLREQVISNTKLNAFLSTWWRDVSKEYTFDEVDMHNAYAKVILLHWCNRIIFAHLIKDYHNGAYSILELKSDITPKDANEIIELITSTCDFYHIFHSIDYNTFIPNDTWLDLIELNHFLIENKIPKIEQSTLQDILENTVSVITREFAGQFTTPVSLAQLLAEITIQDWNKPCLDPCCGTGSIPKAILDRKISCINNTTTAILTTWASDKYNYPLQLANINLASFQTINEPHFIFQKNVFDIRIGNEVAIVNPQDGNTLNTPIPEFGAILSNLPFISFESLSCEDTENIRVLNQEIKNNTNLELDTRSDIYSFIIFALHRLLESNGRLGVITSNSWLGTSAGKVFFQILNHYYKVNQIHISGKGKWFTNADVVAVILILTKNDDVNIADENDVTIFCKWEKSLEEINENELFRGAIIDSSILESEIDRDVISLNSYKYVKIQKFQSLNISLNALFHNIDWLLDFQEKLIPMNTIFKVSRGERRGWDDMFYPEVGHGIESKFIKKVLKNSKNVTRLTAQADSDAFCCSSTIDQLTQQQCTGALAWINKFKNCLNGTGLPLPQILAKRNQHWYEMRDNSTAQIFTSMNPDKRLFYAKFNESTFVNQRLITLQAKADYTDIELYHALLNSIIGMFYIEAIGFGRGLGVLDISSTTLGKSFMICPTDITQENRDDIVNKFKEVCARDIMNIDEELLSNDRELFDKAVLKAIDMENYYENIKESLLSMYETRSSVRPA